MLLTLGDGTITDNLSSGYLADRIGATCMMVISLLMSSVFCITIVLTLMC